MQVLLLDEVLSVPVLQVLHSILLFQALISCQLSIPVLRIRIRPDTDPATVISAQISVTITEFYITHLNVQKRACQMLRQCLIRTVYILLYI
jgi:hypothetical protein